VYGILKLGVIAVPVGHLCGKAGGALDTILHNASPHGFSCFPTEMPLQFRTQYRDQHRPENLLVAMNPIETPFDKEPAIFGIAHDDRGQVVTLRNGAPGTVWPASAIFLFSTGPVVESPLIKHSTTH
jgi:hypothetical protein